MTARALDVAVVRNKLDAVERATTTLGSIVPLDAERGSGDAVIAAAVGRLVCRLVELATDINTHISAAVLGRVRRVIARASVSFTRLGR